MSSLAHEIAQNPQIAVNMAAIESVTAAYSQAGGSGNEDSIIRIPVVFHVVYYTLAPAQNIPNSDLISQIAVLNEDFRRLNADQVNTPAQWQNIGADCGIEFCLATIDPLGFPTTGITRTATFTQVFSQILNDVKTTASGGHDPWPTTQYLNIWVCPLNGTILGYSQFPGGNPATDGVVLDYRNVGRFGTAVPPQDRGRVGVHEVGHWLNLRHIWGDVQPNCGDDFVADTPMADGPRFGCQTTSVTCGGPNMIQNYMDYSDDICLNLFTVGQRTRMRATFQAGGGRTSLLTSPAVCAGSQTAIQLYQVNSGAASLTLNGVLGTATSAAVTNTTVNSTVAVSFGSTPAGRPFDTLFAPGPLVPSGGGALITKGSQLMNLDATNPGLIFLNSGTLFPSLLPFAANVTVNVVPGVSGTASAQLVIVTPTSIDGFVFSQGCQLNIAAAPACTFPAGPSGDDASATIPLVGAGGCVPAFSFYGTSYTNVYLSSNGRITFGGADTSPSPTIAGAAVGRPFIGFWTDLNPSINGTIAATSPVPGRLRIDFAGVPYKGANASSVTFAIEIDTSNNSIALDSLSTIPANPLTSAQSTGQNQFLGLSRGTPSAFSLGLTTFAPGASGASAAANAMLFDFYDRAASFAGRPTSLSGTLNRIVFTPGVTGNYTWTGF